MKSDEKMDKYNTLIKNGYHMNEKRPREFNGRIYYPRNVCEKLGCSNTNTEVELVYKKPLTLCEIHGPEFGDLYPNFMHEDFLVWTLNNLKKHSVKKWRE